MTQLISTLSPLPIVEEQTRDSVRRASGFVQIAISLFDAKKGEGKAHTCVIAWFRQLTAQVIALPGEFQKMMPARFQSGNVLSVPVNIVVVAGQLS